MRKTLLYFSLILLFSDCHNKNEGENNVVSTVVASSINPLSNRDPKLVLSPEERFGDLFDSVIVNNVFENPKTFLDLVPITTTDSVMELLKEARKKPDFNWQTFVNQTFITPKKNTEENKKSSSESIEEHIKSSWSVLTRPADTATLGSILPIPRQYIAASKFNNELTYNDAYFIMLGLQAAGKVDMIENMVEDFAHLINTEGFIPSGNRSYYMSRSNPPFFACMVQLLAEMKGHDVLAKYLPQLEKEYSFWMEGAQDPAPKNIFIHHHVIQMERNTLNRYYDGREKPRPEQYLLDIFNAQSSIRPRSETYRHIRASAESGWDFSSRWFEDGRSINTINTSDIIPVDLNALMYNLELTISKGKVIEKKYDEATEWEKKASKRRDALMRYCWAESKGMFFDFNMQKYRQTGVVSAAAAYPLFFKMVSKRNADRVILYMKQNLLFNGGIVSTNNRSGQSWDAPYGSAPMQWIAIKGFRNYGQENLANDIKNRWVGLNSSIFKNSGKIFDRYNVQDSGDAANNGENPPQEDSGWSNGVLLKLLTEK